MNSKAACVSLLLNEMMEDEEETEEDVWPVVLSTVVSLCTSNECRAKIDNYVEEVVPNYTDEVFRRMFRLNKPTFTTICDFLRNEPELNKSQSGGDEMLSVEKQILITLWYLGGLETVNKIADRFGISESTFIASRDRVIECILNKLKDRFIKWPNRDELQEDIQNFSQRNGFPGIAGCLDGTHIAISQPLNHPIAYMNRKKYHSLQLQAVCRCDMRFTDVFVRYPGSCHDARVLRNSELFTLGPQVCQFNSHILADAAYPLRSWLLTPYRDNGHLDAIQRRYNYYHSSNRVVIERAFGLLKGIFRRLRYLHTHTIQSAVNIIMACCVLHNICILQHDEINEFLVEDDGNNVNNFRCQVGQQLDDNGIQKRNAIAQTL